MIEVERGKLSITERGMFWGGQRVAISKTYASVIAALAIQLPGVALTFAEMEGIRRPDLENLWKHSDYDFGNLRTAVSRVRRKLREIDPSFDCLQNIPTWGYEWKDPQ